MVNVRLLLKDIILVLCCCGSLIIHKNSHSTNLDNRAHPTAVAARELATADSLTPVIEQLSYQWDYVKAFPLAVQQLDTRMRHLGLHEAKTLESWQTVGELLISMRNKALAADVLRFTVEQRRAVFGRSHEFVAESLISLASVHRLFGERDIALALLAEAEAIVHSIPLVNHPVNAQLVGMKGSIMRKRVRYSEVEPNYREAYEIRRRYFGEPHPITIATKCWLAYVVRQDGRISEAIEIWRETYDTAKQSDVPDLGILHVITNNLGRFLTWEGSDEEAEAMLRESIAIEDGLESKHPASFGIGRWLSGGRERLAQILVESGRPDDAWEVMEHGAGRITEVLRGPLRLRNEEESTPVLDDLRGEVLRNERELRRLERMDTRAERVNVLLSLVRLESSLVESEAALVARVMPESNALLSVERVQSALQPGQAIVGWIEQVEPNGYFEQVGRFRLYGYVVRSMGSVEWVKLFDTADRSDWDNLVGSGRRAMKTIRQASIWPQRVRQDDVLAKELHTYWDVLLKPLERYLDGVDELLVYSNRLQTGLPLQCLIDQTGRSVIDRYAVSYIPSATVYTELVASRTDHEHAMSRPALVVGAPNFGNAPADEVALAISSVDAVAEFALDNTLLRGVLDGEGSVHDLPRLPMSLQESHAIASNFNSATLLVGDEASEERLDDMVKRQELRNYGTIHFATHALVHPNIPLRSALAVVPGDASAADNSNFTHDGLVTTREIQLGWVLTAELVTLSGCQTGWGPKQHGESPVGFQQAFFGAGARAIVSSMWEVDDVATRLLMDRFYHAMARPTTEDTKALKASALREAQLWLRDWTDESGRKPFEHPAYWAGFVLVGDPN